MIGTMAEQNIIKMIKRKKPRFYRQDAHKKPSLGYKWRCPKGIDSKMRLKLGGYRKSPCTGYGAAKSIFGLHPTGLAMLVVSSISQLKDINPTKTGILLSSTLGQKKKVGIIKEAEKKKIKILNMKNTAAYLKEVEDNMKKRKDKKEKAVETKEKKKKDLEKEAEKKEKEEKREEESIEGALSEEEKKKEEKKEKDKVLIKKE